MWFLIVPFFFAGIASRVIMWYPLVEMPDFDFTFPFVTGYQILGLAVVSAIHFVKVAKCKRDDERFLAS